MGPDPSGCSPTSRRGRVRNGRGLDLDPVPRWDTEYWHCRTLPGRTGRPGGREGLASDLPRGSGRGPGARLSDVEGETEPDEGVQDTLGLEPGVPLRQTHHPVTADAEPLGEVSLG